jgi:hypothetical protein
LSARLLFTHILWIRAIDNSILFISVAALVARWVPLSTLTFLTGRSIDRSLAVPRSLPYHPICSQQDLKSFVKTSHSATVTAILWIDKMKRIDSGFQESFLSKAHNERQPQPMVRSNTAPTHRRKSNKRSVDNSPSIGPTRMDPQRPRSESMSRPTHQRSKTSSSETSTTRSKGRGHGSKPSSRRTSCTIVDPSRSRHYRMQSSNTVPTAKSQDIDDVYALHHRSYNLFQNPSLHTKSALPSPAISQAGHFDFPGSSPRFSADERSPSTHYDQPKQSEETITAAERPSTTMHWTSPCTRQREYERIDRANSGFRGLMNKVMPRCVSGPQEKFYEKDQSDTGSVRRYRMDDEEDVADEKELARSRTRDLKKSSAPKTKTKKWGCF